MSAQIQTRHSVAEIPHEIWRIITTFLSSQDVKNLYGINRPLSALAMEERYRSASIGDPQDQETINALQRLADPRRAQYVRVLNFRPTPLAALLSLSAKKYWIKKSLKILGMLIMRKKAFVARPQAVLSVVGNLSFITSLTLECHITEYVTSFKKSLPFIAAGWASFGPNLRYLYLKIPLEAMHDAIGSVKLPNLQSLTIDFSLGYHSIDGPQIILETVIPFINHHTDTLRSLGLRTWGPFNIFKPLHEVVHIPMLDNLTLYQASDLEEMDLFGLHSFLLTHSRTLKKLDMQFYSYYPDAPYDAWFATQWSRVALPELQSLVLKVWMFSDEHFQGVVNYVTQYTDTLASLDVTLFHFYCDQIGEFASLFSTQGRLRKLALTARVLTPHVLFVLFNKLPFLEDLSLKFYGLAAQVGEVTDHVAGRAEFCKEMGNVFIREWKVRNLILNSLNLECKRALADALPNVRTFNGDEREVYLSGDDID